MTTNAWAFHVFTLSLMKSDPPRLMYTLSSTTTNPFLFTQFMSSSSHWLQSDNLSIISEYYPFLQVYRGSKWRGHNFIKNIHMSDISCINDWVSFFAQQGRNSIIACLCGEMCHLALISFWPCGGFNPSINNLWYFLVIYFNENTEKIFTLSILIPKCIFNLQCEMLWPTSWVFIEIVKIILNCNKI